MFILFTITSDDGKCIMGAFIFKYGDSLSFTFTVLKTVSEQKYSQWDFYIARKVIISKEMLPFATYTNVQTA